MTENETPESMQAVFLLAEYEESEPLVTDPTRQFLNIQVFTPEEVTRAREEMQAANQEGALMDFHNGEVVVLGQYQNFTMDGLVHTLENFIETIRKNQQEADAE
jgi:hypothetical protein